MLRKVRLRNKTLASNPFLFFELSVNQRFTMMLKNLRFLTLHIIPMDYTNFFLILYFWHNLRTNNRREINFD